MQPPFLARHALLWLIFSAPLASLLTAAAPDVFDPAGLDSGRPRGSLRSVLRPIADVRLSVRAAGIIERFHVEEGATLRAGAPILSLDSDTEQAELLQAEAIMRGAKAELDRATAEYDRVKPLSAENIFSEKQLQEAKTGRDLAASRFAQTEASLALAKSRLANRTLTTPIDGIFLKTSKSVGEAVDRFETVARIVNVSRLELLVYADARYFEALHALKSVQISVHQDASKPAITVQAEVAHVDPIVDPSSGTFRVRLHLPLSKGVASGYTAVLIPPAI